MVLGEVTSKKDDSFVRVYTFLLYIVRQSVKLLTLLIAISVLTFVLLHFSPIDPVQAYIGADAALVSSEQRAAIAAHWGLDEPKIKQYFHWLFSVFSGDLGTSMIHRMAVSTVIFERFFASIALMATSWILAGAIGFFLGIVAGIREGTWIDRLIKWYCFTLASTPTFWLGLLLLIVFSVWLGLFPVGLGTPAGMLTEDVTIIDRLKHLILPAVTLSMIGIANVTMHTRQKLVEVLHSDYILFAKAQGESGYTLLWRHALRNVSLPAISVHFASFSELFGGVVLAEQVFSYPGLGEATVEAGLRGDVPLLLGIVLFTTIFVFIGNTVADLLYKWIDPRMRAEEIG